MSIAKYLMLGAMTLGLVIGVMGCTTTSHGIVRVPRQYDEVFSASLAALQEAEFTVISQARETGTIGAEKRLPRAEGDRLHMTVRLKQESTGVTTVVATAVPPAGPLAKGEKPCKCHLKRFVQALEHRIPEVEVVTIE
jgi:hypothetical protein